MFPYFSYSLTYILFISRFVCGCVCIPILVTMFPEWLSATEPLPHTRRRASVLVVFVVFCVNMYSFAGLIRRTPPPTFSDTAITDRHSDTTIFQLRAHWVRISWSIGSEKSLGRVPPVQSICPDFASFYIPN